MQENDSVSKGWRILLILLWPGTWCAAYLLYCWVSTFPDIGYWPTISDPLSLLIAFSIPWNTATLLVICFQIVGSILIWKAADPKSVFIRLTCVSFCAMLGGFAGWLYYWCVPGLIIPFLNHPIWRLVMLGLLFWQVVGVVLLYKTENFWLWLLEIAGFSVPLALLMRIGPYLQLNAQVSAERAAEIMARPGFRDIWKLDAILIAVVLVVACASFSGWWITLFRLQQKEPVASTN